MVTLFRKAGKGPWIVKYYDEAGKRREVSTGTTHRTTAQQIANEIERKAALRKAGLLDPRDERRAEEDRKPIAKHVEAFAANLAAKGGTPAHVRTMRRHVAELIGAMGATRVSGITPAAAQAAIAKIRETHATSTTNQYLVALKGFTRWLVRDGRIHFDPLVGISRYNAATDVRHKRRALTTDEVSRLLAAAEAGRGKRTISGVDRAMLYRLALGTGFRVAELVSLTKSSFALDAKPPTITVLAACSKHRREDVQPIRADLAERLRPWLATRGSGALFPARVKRHGAEMMRTDLKRAGIAYRTDAGFADFHALRATYITNVVRAGASVKEAQSLARHADPALTFKVYARATLEDTARVLDSIPSAESSHLDPHRLPSQSDASRRSATDSKSTSNRRAGGVKRRKTGNAG